jgi:hypothetical protein
MKIPYEVEILQDGVIVGWNNINSNTEGSVYDCTYLKPVSVCFSGNITGGAEAFIQAAIKDEFFPILNRQGYILSSMVPMIDTFSGRYPKIKSVVVGGDENTRVNINIFFAKVNRR